MVVDVRGPAGPTDPLTYARAVAAAVSIRAAPMQEKLQVEPPPLLVLVHGPPKVSRLCACVCVWGGGGT
jgi:hypothetical protein